MRDPKTGMVVVVSGPKTKPVVVVAKRKAVSSSPVTVEPGAPGAAPSSPGTPATLTLGAADAVRSRNQLAPATTAKTRVPAARTTIVADMRRPTRTLLRREKPVVTGASDSARRWAICLASSSELGKRRPLGWGNRYFPSPCCPGPRKLRRAESHVNDQKEERGRHRPLSIPSPRSGWIGTGPDRSGPHRTVVDPVGIHPNSQGDHMTWRPRWIAKGLGPETLFGASRGPTGGRRQFRQRACPRWGRAPRRG